MDSPEKKLEVLTAVAYAIKHAREHASPEEVAQEIAGQLNKRDLLDLTAQLIHTANEKDI